LEVVEDEEEEDGVYSEPDSGSLGGRGMKIHGVERASIARRLAVVGSGSKR
jgi:hypothetical protein